MKYTEITHPSHPHDLVLGSAEEPYQCDGCKEVGFGPCFKCEQCNFNLHEECAMPEPSAFHPFFSKCDFRFYENAPGSSDRFCDACGKDVRGFVYQCSHENDLHPCCMKLQRTLIGDGVKLHLSDKVSTGQVPKMWKQGNIQGFQGLVLWIELWAILLPCGVCEGLGSWELAEGLFWWWT